MPDNRFYIDAPLTLDSLKIEGEEAHHLLHVMRAREGDLVELVNGRGSLAEAQVKAINKRDVTLDLVKHYPVPPPPFPLIIAQAMPRFNRLDTLLEKGTELGMSELWLFTGERSEKAELSENQKERAHKIMVAAMKQCGRLYLPEIRLLPPLKMWTKPEFPLYYGTLEEGVPTLLKAWKPAKGAIFAVGPEKGFSLEELQLLKQLGGTGVTLHPNILRTETAPLAALSIMSQFI
jgi:16S rRNA (uracil1498-N3)-methyltransferase